VASGHEKKSRWFSLFGLGKPDGGRGAPGVKAQSRKPWEKQFSGGPKLQITKREGVHISYLLLSLEPIRDVIRRCWEITLRKGEAVSGIRASLRLRGPLLVNGVVGGEKSWGGGVICINETLIKLADREKGDTLSCKKKGSCVKRHGFRFRIRGNSSGGNPFSEGGNEGGLKQRE